MDTSKLDVEKLTQSVIAVPPLARGADLSLDRAENEKMIRYLEAGGVSSLLYGGNANFYHIPLSEYEETLSFLEGAVAENTLLIPSIGPTFGLMQDQAKALRGSRFASAMVLPMSGMVDSQGARKGIALAAETLGRSIVLYIKSEDYLTPADVEGLCQEGVVSCIKYAIPRADPAQDGYLSELVDRVDRGIIISGFGEQPAIVHMKQFGLCGFTSGLVCVNPSLSMAMLRAIQRKDFVEAERIREIFAPMEDRRNAIHPVRVLHAAVALAGIADTGEMLPLLSPLARECEAQIKRLALSLREATG